ncbi:MAG: terminase gpA endonuclease subunit [Aureliella sp.]
MATKSTKARKPQKKPTKKPAKNSPAAELDAYVDGFKPAGRGYAARKERERQRQADQSREGRDIGPIPPCADPALRDKVSKSLRLFCEIVLAERFKLAWSPDHLKAIEKIERAILEGDVFALAMPRGSGKTTLIVAACLWAIVNGYRRYVCLIGADRDAATKLLGGLKVELETNDILLELYPEAAYPVRKLEGKANKATGQLLDGERTYIEWKGPRIVLADVPGAKCRSACVEVYGLLGRIRGAQFSTPAGETLRPDLFVLDDPQTDRSALSPSQVARRLNVITGTVLGLAGPGQSITGFATVTVIKDGDVADQLLNRDLYPDWQGERFRLVYQWPEDLDLWEQYATLRAEGVRAGRGLADATAFYAKHRKAMDKGAKPAWPERFDPKRGEISAIQHAFNLKLKSPLTFDAEFQNEPLPASSDVERLAVDSIEAKTHGHGRDVLPPAADLVTAFIDVQGSLLYYLVAAWESSSFTGYVLAYGSWPRQTAVHFTLRNATKTLASTYHGKGLEGRIRSGLFDLVDAISAARYKTPDGQLSQRVQLIGIDAAWGPSTKVVQAVALEHPRSSWIVPTFGRGIKPTDGRQMSEWQAKPGERKGPFWILRPTLGGGRHAIVDTNAAKTFVNSRLNVAIGDPGSLSLYRPSLLTEHRMLAEHWTAETVETVTSSGGRSGEVWELPPAKPDNHLWDCLVGSAVMASLSGAQLGELKIRKANRTKGRYNRRPTSVKL